MKQALVLGGTSFFGRELVQLLLNQNYSVTLFSRGQKNPEFDGELEWIHGNRSNPSDIKKLSHKNYDIAFDQIGFCSQDAQVLVEEIGSKIQKLVFTSSQSIYPMGPALLESSLDPSSYPMIIGPREQFDYGEGKRQAEAYYFQKSPFKVAIARPSIVIGPNDHSGRFKFHVDKIGRGKEFHLPNPQAKFSVLRSSDAALGLLAIGEDKAERTVTNFSTTTVVLQEFMRTIANAIEGRIKYSENSSGDHFSPYGVNEDWWMDRTKIEKIIKVTHNEFLDYVTELAMAYENDS